MEGLNTSSMALTALADYTGELVSTVYFHSGFLISGLASQELDGLLSDA